MWNEAITCGGNADMQTEYFRERSVPWDHSAAQHVYVYFSVLNSRTLSCDGSTVRPLQHAASMRECHVLLHPLDVACCLLDAARSDSSQTAHSGYRYLEHTAEKRSTRIAAMAKPHAMPRTDRPTD